MKVVGRFIKLEDAHLARMQLESAGMDAIVSDEASVNAMPHLATAIGGVRVWVPDDQWEEAQALIHHKPETPREAAPLVCPRCGSPAIADEIHKKRAYIPSFLILILLMLPVPLIKHRYECTACGHLWK